MKILIADECSVAWDDKVSFFIYGGIVVDESEARPLVEDFLEIKKKYGLPKERPIKWNRAVRGVKALDKDIHRAIKDEILELFSESDARIIVCLSPHQFYHSLKIKSNDKAVMSIDPDVQLRTHEYGLNDLLEKFDRYVGDGGSGMVLVDRFGGAVKNHMDKHCRAMFPEGTERYGYSNIVLPVIQVDDGDSYLHQINDIVLGAIYTSLREMGINLLPRIRKNFWAADSGDGPKIKGNGFTVYPQKPRRKWSLEAKIKMEDKFKRLISDV